MAEKQQRAKQTAADSTVIVGDHDTAPPIPGAAVDLPHSTVGHEAAAQPEIPPEKRSNLAPPKPGTFTLVGNAFYVYGEDGTLHEWDGEMVEFISRDPGLSIELGEVVVRFALGRVHVPEPLADRLCRHFLYQNGRYYRADEVAIVGGEIVSYRENKHFHEQMLASRAGDAVMYATKLNANLVVEFGDFQVRFEDGYAAVPKDRVERFEKHMFVREQRITRIE